MAYWVASFTISSASTSPSLPAILSKSALDRLTVNSFGTTVRLELIAAVLSSIDRRTAAEISTGFSCDRNTFENAPEMPRSTAFSKRSKTLTVNPQ